jgi:hypothetical protein
MLTKPKWVVALVAGVAMLFVESANATRFDSAPVDVAPASGAMTRLPGHILPALVKARRINSGENAGKQPVTLTLILNRDDQAGFESFLREIYDPHSLGFRHFLTPIEVSDRFGPSQASYDAVLFYLQECGLKLVEGSADRMTITVHGTRGEAERAFELKIGDYRLGQRRFYANDRDPALPDSLARYVAAVLGLSNYARPELTFDKVPPPRDAECEFIKSVTGNIIGGAIGLPVFIASLSRLPWVATPAWIIGGASALLLASCVYYWSEQYGYYNRTTIFSGLASLAIFLLELAGDTLPNSSLIVSPATAVEDSPLNGPGPGAGQTIGLLEFDTFHPNDVADFVARFNSGRALFGVPALDAANVTSIQVNGGAGPSPGVGESEVLLDIDVAMSIAPGAKVVVYSAPFAGTGSFQPVLDKMINDGVTIISNSWAYCEDQTTAADVQSIDKLLQGAAAAGISVFSGTGDNGSTCLDGSPNTLAVPADSPNLTAVGGSSMTLTDGLTYGSETYWDGATSTPPSGSGGFGVSRFFAKPGYQNALNSSPTRSVPDVVLNADPAKGTWICQADDGGCPSGLYFGGTSAAAPSWAGLTALLNQQVGKPLGFLNPLIYPFADTAAFHDAASLGSDFAEVGLGSPNLDELFLRLTNQTAGPPSSSESLVSLFVPSVPSLLGISADGSTNGSVVVRLLDSNGQPVGGKTVALAASSGSNVQITPPSGVTSVNGGSVVFKITDLTPETVTFTATDTSDHTTLAQQATAVFAVPPAASGEIVASLGNEPADGTTADTITATLRDSLGRPTPGKLVTLSQGAASSVITAPSPGVTDGNGQVQFAVTDIHTENVTYTATDVSDGSLPVPGNATVDFTNGAGGCPSSSAVTGTANSALGYRVSNFANGFTVSNGNQGFSYNCFGAYGMAWDASDNLYVTDWPTGNIYKFDSSGGIADANHLFTTVKAPATGLAIDPADKMFASEGSVSGPNGDVVPVDLSTGAVGTAIASGFPCLGNMAIDPAIPALYVNDFCSLGPVSPNIWQITGIDGPSPTTTVYAQTPENIENFNLAVAPDGTLYDVYAATTAAPIARITPGSPPTVTTLTASDGSPISLSGGLGMTVGGKQASGDAQFVIAPFNSQANTQSGLPEAVRTLDLTGSAPAPALQLTTSDFSGLSNFAIGPDGCLYVAGGPTVSKVTNGNGTCSFGPKTQRPALSLTPTTVSPNPLQGTSQSFTANFHYATVPTGTPVFLNVNGDNVQVRAAMADANGQASLSYTGIAAGTDSATATSTVNNTILVSNPVQVTWEPGLDTTFLTLNLSAKSAVPSEPVTLTASLSDISKSPAMPLAGEPVTLALGNDTCGASTDEHGNASCEVNPQIIPGNPSRELTADFVGTADLTAAQASADFLFTAPPEDARLRVRPKVLHFGAHDLGTTSEPLLVHVLNPTRKKKKITITFLGADNTGDFTIVSGPPTTCDDTLAPKDHCKIALTFSPTAAGKRKGTLMIDDNAERNEPQIVKLRGRGE